VGVAGGAYAAGPYQVVAKRAGLAVLADLKRALENRTRALHDARVARPGTGRCHASDVGRTRATCLTDSVGQYTVKAESEKHLRVGNQRTILYRFAHRRRVGRGTSATIHTALGMAVFSSTQNTAACCGGLTYSAITSAALRSKSGSSEAV
jgi:hypothetical protein